MFTPAIYPDLFERNVNNFMVSIANTAQGSPGPRARNSNFRQFAYYPVAPAAGCGGSEARVRCRFMAKPAARENYHPGFRPGFPTGAALQAEAPSGRGMHIQNDRGECCRS
jgi:hypothetical protein